MVTASLRSPKKADAKPAQAKSKSVVITSEPVEVEGVKVESTTGMGVDLAELVSDNEPTSGQPAEQQEKSETRAVATRPNMAVSTHVDSGDGLEGDWSSLGRRLPQLKIVQGKGELSKRFDDGTIIYDDVELLPPPSMKEGAVNKLIRFVPISVKLQFQEKLTDEAKEADPDLLPRTAEDAAQVENEFGGTTIWPRGEPMPDNFWAPSARCIFLIEQPEGTEHAGFALELNGKSYGVAVYYATGGAFWTSAKVISDTARTSLLVPVLDDAGQPKKDDKGRVLKARCLPKCFWTIGWSKESTKTGYVVWKPKVKLLPNDLTCPEVRSYCLDFRAGAAQAVAAESDE